MILLGRFLKEEGEVRERERERRDQEGGGE